MIYRFNLKKNDVKELFFTNSREKNIWSTQKQPCRKTYNSTRVRIGSLLNTIAIKIRKFEKPKNLSDAERIYTGKKINACSNNKWSWRPYGWGERFCFILVKSKKSTQAAAQADLTIIPDNITPEDIYEERNTVRKQKCNDAFLPLGNRAKSKAWAISYKYQCAK